jgi:hypothetical protein
VVSRFAKTWSTLQLAPRRLLGATGQRRLQRFRKVEKAVYSIFCLTRALFTTDTLLAIGIQIRKRRRDMSFAEPLQPVTSVHGTNGSRLGSVAAIAVNPKLLWCHVGVDCFICRCGEVIVDIQRRAIGDTTRWSTFFSTRVVVSASRNQAKENRRCGNHGGGFYDRSGVAQKAKTNDFYLDGNGAVAAQKVESSHCCPGTLARPAGPAFKATRG